MPYAIKVINRNTKNTYYENIFDKKQDALDALKNYTDTAIIKHKVVKAFH